MMVLAAAVAHWASVTARRAGTEPQRATRIRLASVVMALMLIAGGDPGDRPGGVRHAARPSLVG